MNREIDPAFNARVFWTGFTEFTRTKHASRVNPDILSTQPHEKLNLWSRTHTNRCGGAALDIADEWCNRSSAWSERGERACGMGQWRRFDCFAHRGWRSDVAKAHRFW